MSDHNGDEAAASVFSDTLHGKGWGRTLPPAAVVLLGEIALGGCNTRELLDRRLRQNPHSPEGLASSAWDPLHDWTDEELARLDAEFGAADDELSPAADVRTAEAVEREERLATMERYLTAKGLPAQHSIEALLDLLVACDVVLLDASGTLTLNANAPLPAETLPLSLDEAAVQDDLRWRHLHEQTAQSIIQLFRPDDQIDDCVITTLQELSEQLHCDPEDARIGVQLLLEEGDFTTDVPAETVRSNQRLTIRVDWAAFNTTRMSIKLGDTE